MGKQSGKSILILLIIQFLVMVGFGIIIPILPFFLDKLGGGPEALGIFMSVYSVMQFFFAPFWGRLSDRIGRRPVLLIGLSGYGLTFIMFGLANPPTMKSSACRSGKTSTRTLRSRPVSTTSSD